MEPGLDVSASKMGVPLMFNPFGVEGRMLARLIHGLRSWLFKLDPVPGSSPRILSLAPKIVGLVARESISEDAHSTPSIAHGSFLEREADYQTRPKFPWLQLVTPSLEETHATDF